jgi:5-methyltetrahydrofolate--homocysteine methyltransferase
VLVGERTNVIGSKKFRELIQGKKFEEAAEVARGQVKQGAQIIDICLASPDSDEISDMEEFLKFVIKMIRVPLMLDSTDHEVIAKALTYCQGKAIINSINLEDGEERFETIVPLAKSFGAAVVVGTIDDDPDQGMGVTRARKLQIAQRSFKLLTEKYGMRAEDIYWDPLVFPCATGDKQYVGSAPETIAAIKLLKDKFPGTKTVLGISNVSFGLPASGREVLNSVFLYHCVQAGLDLAIVNSEKLERYAKISEFEKALSEDLLFRCDDSKIAAFTEHFRNKKSEERETKAMQLLTPEERLSRYIIEGTKEGLIGDLDLALKSATPLNIINGPLMRGMDEVGRLFNNNELIVAEVLQSAEVMKAAVNHLEPLMDKDDSSQRGKMVLATVKGDVHDIGKNLVDIIFSNNGFKVFNLGIKISAEEIIRAVRTHNPDIVGLSGLLVKSAQQMVLTAQDLQQQKIDVPLLVGGAALTESFTLNKITPAYGEGSVFYARDAMQGLDLAKQIVDKDRLPALKETWKIKREEKKAQLEKAKLTTAAIGTEKYTEDDSSPKRSGAINFQEKIPLPADFDRDLWFDPLTFEGLIGSSFAREGSAYSSLFRADGFAKPKAELMQIPWVAKKIAQWENEAVAFRV